MISDTKDFIQTTCNNVIVTISIFKEYYSAAALIMLLDIFVILGVAWFSLNISIIITTLSLFVCVLFVIWGFIKIMVNYCKRVICYKNKNNDIDTGLIMTQNDIVVTGNIIGITILSFIGAIIFTIMLIIIVV